MDYKNLAYTLYKNLDNVNNKIDIITKLFKIHKSTFYKWLNEYDNNIKNVNDNIYTDFNSHLITKQYVIFIVSFFIYKDISKKNIKLLKKELNKLHPNNNLSISQIHSIINKNKHCLPETKYKGKYNKISIQIENFIIDSIKKIIV